MEDPRSLIVDALNQVAQNVDVEVAWGHSNPDRPDDEADLLVRVWDVALAIDIKQYALVDESIAMRLTSGRRLTGRVDRRHDADADRMVVVVADRVTKVAREILLEGNVGYLDRRGHLALRAPRLVIDTPVHLGWKPPQRSEALAGKAGLEIAAALLMAPSRGPAVRELARELDRSPSTVSGVLARLKADDRITQDNRVQDERLFWDLAERWPTGRAYLANAPTPGEHSRLTAPLQLGLTDVELSTGWALTDTAAAAAFGAPVAVRADQALDFYVPSTTALRRAQMLLGEASHAGTSACAVRVAPVPATCTHRIDARDNYFEWPTAHPIFIALDLAQDIGRGREILADWNPPGWTRVW